MSYQKSKLKTVFYDDLQHCEYESDDVYNKCGVYGIFIDNKLRYIGSTSQPFSKRYEQHLDVFKNKREPTYSCMRIYKYMARCKQCNADIDMRPLEMYELGEISDHRIQVRELTWILKYKECLVQVEGVLKPFRFSK